MNTTTNTPCYISLNRLAKLTDKARITLLMRVKDSKLLPDATLDLGNGKSLPLFRPDKVTQLRPASSTKTSPHPLM